MVSRPRSRSPISRSVTSVVFSVEPSTSASGCLVPSMPIPSATTHRCSPKCTPSIINATRSSPDRSAASSSASAVSVAATNRRETADLLVAVAACSTCSPDRLQPDRVAAGREPGQHPAHRHPAQHLGGGEQLIGGHRQLAGTVDGAHPRPGSPAPAARPGSPSRPRVPCRTAPRSGSCLPFGPHTAVTSASIIAGHHLQPGRRPRAPAVPRACPRRSRPSPHSPSPARRARSARRRARSFW